ncbi:MAG: DUF2523 domain-containing protein [Brachymonas sp.]|nr:DUF2523 domain-containing protein [Brachymonas sp.]
MPALAAAILGALISGIGTLVGRVLVSLGIAYVAYSGIDALINTARAQFISSVQGLPALAIQLTGVLQIGTCVSILTSAFLTRLIVRGLSSGVVTRMVTRV